MKSTEVHSGHRFLKTFPNNPVVTNKPNRSNDHTFMLNTKTTTVPSSLRSTLAPLNIAGIYSLSNTKNNFFKQLPIRMPLQVYLKLSINHTAPNKGLLQVYFHRLLFPLYI